VRTRPIGLRGTRISGGLWAERRWVNREVTIPHGAEQLEAAGNLDNFRAAAGRHAGPLRGGADDAGRPFAFLDSDVYKWLEAAGWELGQAPAAAIAGAAEQMIELVAAAQRADGYLNTHFQVGAPGREFRDLQWGHELYTLGHLVQAAIAWHRALGDARLLRVARRAVDRVADELGPGRRELIDGHPEIEMALVELYRCTGEERYLVLARTLLDRRGRGLLGGGRFGSRYWQDHEPVRSAAEPAGHAVRQVYLDCGAADVAMETGDRELLAAVIRRWQAMVASRTYLTGGIGAHHRDEAFGAAYELPPDRAYAETCAAIGSVMLAWRLLLATGESRFADLIERTALNGILAGLSLDGRRFFYVNPLLVRSHARAKSGGATSGGRAPWFACACCPPNLMRFLATVPDLVATVDDHRLRLHQFASGSIEAALAGGRVAITVETGYPWSGEVELEVAQAPASEWALSVRVPAWCRSGSVTVDGREQAIAPGPGTVEFSRVWQPGDRVRLRLDMPPRFTAPDPRIDAIRGTVALERGPLVYAIEEAGLPTGIELESVEVDPAPEARPAAEPSLPGITTLLVEAIGRAPDRSAGWPNRDHVAPGAGEGTPITLRAVPYFTWGNRAGGGMRVWLPATRHAGALDVRR
jgi:DUF1680 family protein